MASPFTELEVLTIGFSLLVFALFTLTGILTEERVHSNDIHSAVIMCTVPVGFNCIKRERSRFKLKLAAVGCSGYQVALNDN
ncbi:hypothetical protein KUCAC02_015993 [Chaenocephalus aceratus]|uniref:Uncharacterized protein n=1 Tax=Chaenocephalus aceratus TaxID=36190 RepID=A0ACB9Y1G0_CHAAC|nr:hypothetical protein KUCAC02_015993 [Chaenocephalus aceratus]